MAVERRVLDADAAAFLARVQGTPPVHAGTPEQAMAAHLASAAQVAGPGEPVENVTDTEVGGVAVRVYRPADAAGITVYLHGGGWMVGTLDSYDTLCRAIANRSGTTVVAVGYALAPGARHPTQLAQVLGCLRWVAANAEDLSGPGGIALAGDSAGGHLAALTASRAPSAGVPLCAQALIYPVVEPGLDRPSARENATGYYFETESMRWYWAHYLPPDPAVTEIPTSLLDLDPTDSPPTLVVTAGFDPLRDEGIAYADHLEQGGIPVVRIHFTGQIHGFVRLTALVGDAWVALDAVGAFLRRRATAEPGSPLA